MQYCATNIIDSYYKTIDLSLKDINSIIYTLFVKNNIIRCIFGFMQVLERIKEIRQSKKISQKKMAELLNISQPGYQKIEQGINVLSVERFMEICRILEIDSYNLLLPAVNVDIVEQLDKVLLGGSMAFDNIKSNSNYSRRLVQELIEKIETGNFDILEIVNDLKFIDEYLSIIGNDSFKYRGNLTSIREFIEKVD